MGKLKKKSAAPGKDTIKNGWENLASEKKLSTKERLEKLVTMNLKRQERGVPAHSPPPAAVSEEPFRVIDVIYPRESKFGGVRLADWESVPSELLTTLTGDETLRDVDPEKLLYFDLETTGLSGGTGTVPFMSGFGYFDSGGFHVKIFVLNDLAKEEAYLDAMTDFLDQLDTAVTVTYNGKAFDFPLMETRYILYRKRFPLLKKPHIDFLFPARTIWKQTYESRKLSFLGDVLLEISREDDVDPSLIPSLYFNFLRTGDFSLLDKVVEHNALDLVGLSALLLLGIRYLQDASRINDEGEMLGAGILYEKRGDLKKANELFEMARQCAKREEVVVQAVRRLSILKKREKLFEEASELWDILSGFSDRFALRELSIHYEHRKKDYRGAVEFVTRAIETLSLTPAQERDMEKRLNRLKNKITSLENSDKED